MNLETETNKKQYPSFAEYLQNEYRGPYTATDIIIRHDSGVKKGVVLIERKYYPEGLAFPGGMAEHMTWYDNAIKEAKEETGLDIIIDNIERPLCALSGLKDDPRAHIGTLVYTAQGFGVLSPDPKEDAKYAMIATPDELYKLTLTPNAHKWAFDRHKHIAQMYLDYIGYTVDGKKMSCYRKLSKNIKKILKHIEKSWKDYRN